MMNASMHITKRWTILSLIGLLLFLVTGCMGHSGSYSARREAGKRFESYQVMADHNYFYTGSNTQPDSILAIHNSYILTSAHLWTRKQMDQKELQFMVDTMTSDLYNLPTGFFIVNPEGGRIGLLYTPWLRGFVKMEGANRVWVEPPRRPIEPIRDRWRDR